MRAATQLEYSNLREKQFEAIMALILHIACSLL